MMHIVKKTELSQVMHELKNSGKEFETRVIEEDATGFRAVIKDGDSIGSVRVNALVHSLTIVGVIRSSL